MLYIGGVYGGPELTGSTIHAALGKIKAVLGEGRVDDSGSLDIVFHVPGSLFSPEYGGVRTGSFSKKERILQVQIAVPLELCSQDQPAVVTFVLDSLREAIRVAGPRYAKAKVPFRQAEYERLVDALGRSLGPN
jgi:hypothetical protein